MWSPRRHNYSHIDHVSYGVFNAIQTIIILLYKMISSDDFVFESVLSLNISV
jgi:hypothetical protein